MDNSIFRLQYFSTILNRKSTGAFGAGLLFSILAAVSECAFSALMIALLVIMGHAQSSDLPQWFPNNPAFLSLKVLISLFVVCGGIRAIVQLLYIHCNYIVLEQVRLRLRLLAGEQLLAGKEGKRPHCLSHINMLMNESIGKASDYVYNVLCFYANMVQALILALVMFYFAWVESLVGLGCLVFLGMASFLLQGRLERTSRQIADQRERLERNLVRVSTNWLLIRIMGLKKREYADFSLAADKYCRKSLSGLFLVSSSNVFPQFSGTIAVAAIFLVSLSAGYSSSADLLAMLYIFSRFVHVISLAASNWSNKVHYRHAFNEVAKDLLVENAHDVKLESGEPADTVIAATEANDPPEILLEGITHAHEPGRVLFTDLTVLIPEGTHFGIIGPNGSGKSTLMALLLGVYLPDAGNVTINKVPADDYLRTSKRVAYVGPEPFLIGGTVRENLLYGNNAQFCRDEELWQALDDVQLKGMLKNRPSGLDTFISESGDGFSYGEKQRLSLARALLRKPLILALDEASANLDAVTEKEVSNLLAGMAGSVTIISVSNKPGILKSCDRILDLKTMMIEKQP